MTTLWSFKGSHQKIPFSSTFPCSKVQQESAQRGICSIGLSQALLRFEFSESSESCPFLRQLPHHSQACISWNPNSSLHQKASNLFGHDKKKKSVSSKIWLTGRIILQEKRKVYTENQTIHLPVGFRISDSGNSSKFEVSSMLLISIEIAAGLSLPRRADGALRFHRQTKQDSATFHFLT